MTENKRPLIEVARERAGAAMRDNVARHSHDANCYIAGYDDGVIAAADIRGMHAATEEIGKLRKRIASLETENAAQATRIAEVSRGE